MLLVSIATALALLVVTSACSGGGKSCASLCTEAQAGKCTAIKGDCTKFCAALDAVKGPANCSSQYSTYQSCLSAKPTVCEASCTSDESALTNCVTPYCSSRILTDTNCQTLAASF
jgi:hypothetical protein